MSADFSKVLFIQIRFPCDLSIISIYFTIKGHILKVIVVFIILFLLTGCEKGKKAPKAQESQIAVQKPKPKPIFTFHDTNGSVVKMEIQDDKIVITQPQKISILLFMTSWCPSCKAQIPEIKALKKKFGQNIAIYGFLLDQPKNIKDFKQKEGIDFFLSTSYKENSRFANLIYHMVHAPANKPIPLTVVLKDGDYFAHYIGAVPFEILRIDIKKALGEK